MSYDPTLFGAPWRKQVIEELARPLNAVPEAAVEAAVKAAVASFCGGPGETLVADVRVSMMRSALQAGLTEVLAENAALRQRIGELEAERTVAEAPSEPAVPLEAQVDGPSGVGSSRSSSTQETGKP